MIPAERKIAMLKYILNNFEEAALQISYTDFVKGDKEESKEYAIRGKVMGEILDLLKSDEQLQNTFIMSQTLAEHMGENINLMTGIINELMQEDEADV